MKTRHLFLAMSFLIRTYPDFRRGVPHIWLWKLLVRIGKVVARGVSPDDTVIDLLGERISVYETVANRFPGAVDYFRKHMGGGRANRMIQQAVALVLISRGSELADEDSWEIAYVRDFLSANGMATLGDQARILFGYPIGMARNIVSEDLEDLQDDGIGEHNIRPSDDFDPEEIERAARAEMQQVMRPGRVGPISVDN